MEEGNVNLPETRPITIKATILELLILTRLLGKRVGIHVLLDTILRKSKEVTTLTVNDKLGIKSVRIENIQLVTCLVEPPNLNAMTVDELLLLDKISRRLGLTETPHAAFIMQRLKKRKTNRINDFRINVHGENRKLKCKRQIEAAT